MNNSDQQRVKFYSRDDLSIGFLIDRVGEIVRAFSSSAPPTDTVDVIEHYEAIQFFKEGIFPSNYDKQDISVAMAKVPQIEGEIGRHFSKISDENFASAISNLDFEYHGRLLELLGKYKVYSRCDSSVVIPALESEGFHLREIVENKNLVQKYDSSIRELFFKETRSAELLIENMFSDFQHSTLHIPKSLTNTDLHQLIHEYIDHDSANFNHLKLIAEAKIGNGAAIDAKIKLKAKRRSDSELSKFFDENDGIRFGSEVRLNPELSETWKVEFDESNGLFSQIDYSTSWFNQTQDSRSILNNFIHLFCFVNEQGILTFPAYSAQSGTLEQCFSHSGKDAYKTGVMFDHLNNLTLSQLELYRRYLESNGLELEEAISWFFAQYLPEEFGANGFRFTPSDVNSSFLQKVRHLFPEIEGIAHQYLLYVENSEIDHELLAIGSQQVRYQDIPTQLDKKYLTQSDGETIAAIIFLLYNDQSPLTHTKDDRKAANTVTLLKSHVITYDDFHQSQQDQVNFLLEQRILTNAQDRIYLTNNSQEAILEALFQYDSLNYLHLSAAEQIEANKMTDKGWLEPRNYLLSEEEAAYFDYCLNARFSNGLNLRNRYLHATQGGDDEHYMVYLIALRLLIALVIKINDDFCLSSPISDSRSNAQSFI